MAQLSRKVTQMAKVFFGFDDALVPGRCEAKYDRSRLRLGALVHVEDRQGEPKFFGKPTTSSVTYAVSWIAPSDWYVVLTRGYQFRAPDLDKLLKAVGGYATEDEVRAACDKCIREMPIEELYLTKTREQSLLGQLMTVADRIDLVKRLSSAESSKLLLDQYEPLVVYLMLTCFDVLGQPAQWRDFRSWLDGKEAAAASLTGSSPVEQSKRLYEDWSGRYGVRNSFYRFMNEVLPPEALERLLASIEYLTLSNPPVIRRQKDGDDKKKRWLFDVRNRFTHSAQVNKGYHSAMFGELPPGKAQKQVRFGRESWEVVTVDDWPQRVIEAVQCGLSAKIKGYAGQTPEEAG
jgi:hypothetical protein